ncbi:MAG: protein translocase subunit SecF [bacterium]|nr:protein translocase subunit SecF [bacterium]
MKLRFIAYLFSGTLLFISFFSFFTKGFNLGIDFTGGVLVQVKFNTAVNIKDLRTALKSESLIGTLIQRIGETKENRFIIKAKGATPDVKVVDFVQEALVKALGQDKIQLPFERTEIVGPTIGKDMRNTAYLLIGISLVAMLIYITFRFTLKYAVGAIIALGHDVFITLGVFSVFQFEVDMTIVAAVLTIIGYSINDTIVVYDRIREFMKIYRGKPLEELIDSSITTTLGRTLVTGLTTLLVCVILFIWGGPVIHYFSLAFIIGIGFGTYSSVYVATALGYDWERLEEAKKHKKA